MSRRLLSRNLTAVVAVVLMVAAFLVVRLPSAPAADLTGVAGRYAFTPMAIAEPGGYPQQTIRKVNQAYQHIDAWISSVGAGIAMDDLDGDGLANDLCVTDPRIDQVVVTPAPGAKADRYLPFALNAAPLPMDHTMAPMGCVPDDFNEDGKMDLLVYYWGRTPIVFLAKASAGAEDALRYTPVELVPAKPGRGYTGPQWNSNAAAVDDFDGDGHIDIYIGNYFPDGPVLDPAKDGDVWMNKSLSNASNGGADAILRWTGATGGDRPTIAYQEQNALPDKVSRGWVLGAGANDLDGDQLPELYLAQDHGRDTLLYNTSNPGHISFAEVEGSRTPGQPKSMQLGLDSFKGMGIDFADLNHDGMYDMFVSNITTTFGVQESNFQWMATAKNDADMRAQLRAGDAPYKNASAESGTAWSGWGWDAKFGDFDNSGDPAIVQTTGFVKGYRNRWPQLQELAMANDQVVDNPAWWPNFRAGDDVAGDQRLHFYARSGDGKYLDVAGQLGLAIPIPTRGVATGDADGDGRLDFAVARQWDAPVFYHNDSSTTGAFLGLRITRDNGSPAVGTQVTIKAADGREQLQRVDGGSGHSGKRSHEVHFGLGTQPGPVAVHLRWRDRAGQVHDQDMQLNPGWHAIQLGGTAEER
ncbi:VCBS repeat protein [Labedaea rhizosphaerae]|uniref:VCBS repeat protein n=1 Tax=Labedaea rhizosphaerae TaxID=598644 RepID=A0A4R6SF57_LABRH|nr:VCBS repeat protein [Labedaea rhizosphaerae]